MSALFNFSNVNTQKEKFFINENINMYIERLSHAIAKMYFVDKNDRLIDIPAEISVFTPHRVKVNPVHTNYYTLCWTDNYDIMFENSKILSIETQRYWNIMTNVVKIT